MHACGGMPSLLQHCCYNQLILPLSTVAHVPHAGRHQLGLKQQQQPEQRTPSPFSLLPNDLLGQVLEMIPAPNVKSAETDPSSLSARAACRWLRDAFDSCNAHLVLVGAAAAGSKDSAQRRSYHALLQRLIARTSSLSSLSIKDWENGRELLKLSVPWGRLKELDLSGTTCQDLEYVWRPEKLQAFGPLALCSALGELAIFSGSLFLSQPDTLPFRSTLQSLFLRYPSNSELGRIGPLFTALQQLTLLGFEDKLDLISIATCTGLRQLTLRLDDFNGVSGMSSLTSLTQLTSLKLCECTVLRDLGPIAELSSLRHLELRGACSITDLSPLGSLRSSLERLVVTGGFSILASSLTPCLSSCTLLRHIEVDVDLENEQDRSFNLSALSACVLLEYLDLGRYEVTGSLALLLPCTRLQRLYLTANRVTALAPLTSLVDLDLSCCEELRDLSPLMACVSLSSLKFFHCPRIKSLAPLAACKQLKVVHLSGCAKVTTLKPIAACTKLVCLNLCGCSRIKSLAPLSACKVLKQLQLRECNSLASLAPLTACRVLERLRLGGCDSLSSLEPLQACTALQRLSLDDLAKPVDLVPLAACPSLQNLDLYRCCSTMDFAPLQSCFYQGKLPYPFCNWQRRALSPT